MPRVRPGLKLNNISTESRQKEIRQSFESKKNTRTWLKDNMTNILQQKRTLPDKRIPYNHQHPTYQRAQESGMGFDIKGWNVGTGPTDVFIHFSKNDQKLKGEFAGDKFHISVSKEQLQDAYHAIAPILCSQESPFEKWKVTDKNKADASTSSGSLRISNGAQFTLYAKPDKPDSTYSAGYLKSVDAVLREVDRSLIRNGISKGIKPGSDVSKGHWNYVSYRNEYHSNRESDSTQQERLKNEPFYRCVD